jgi:predicted Zn-dependent protease
MSLVLGGQPAFRAQSPRWPEGAPVTVWIDAQSAPNGAAALVERAMKTWSDAAADRLRLVRTSDRASAAMRVNFVAGDHVYGEARPHVDRATGAIVGADVHINRALASTGDRLEQQIILYLTALHELGHALGLRHTDDFRTIMYSFRRPDDGARYFGAYRQRLRSARDIGTERATGLAPADVDALRALYDR